MLNQKCSNMYIFFKSQIILLTFSHQIANINQDACEGDWRCLVDAWPGRRQCRRGEGPAGQRTGRATGSSPHHRTHRGRSWGGPGKIWGELWDYMPWSNNNQPNLLDYFKNRSSSLPCIIVWFSFSLLLIKNVSYCYKGQPILFHSIDSSCWSVKPLPSILVKQHDLMSTSLSVITYICHHPPLPSGCGWASGQLPAIHHAAPPGRGPSASPRPEHRGRGHPAPHRPVRPPGWPGQTTHTQGQPCCKYRHASWYIW